ncbi:MAG: hypothetical protein AAGC60_08100 [Acidobacteriota bacterium]
MILNSRAANPRATRLASLSLRYSVTGVASILLLLVVLTAPALAGDTSTPRLLKLDEPLPSERPAAEALFVQRVGADEALVRVVYSDDARRQLGERQIAFGALVLHDDGTGADDRAGDGVFHGAVRLDVEALRAKAEHERAAAADGRLRVTYTASSRAASGAVEPFDLDGYLAGQWVEVRRSTIVSPSGAVDAGGRTLDGATTSPLVVPGTSPFQDEVLMIRFPPVIDDPSRTFEPCTGAGTPGGPWTFGHLMRELSVDLGVPVSTLAEDWVSQWLVPHVINTFPVPARNSIQSLIDDWRADSNGGVVAGPLDVDIAPFRLLAIVPRIDLRQLTATATNPFKGPFVNAGEARFVFGVVVPAHYPRSAGAFPAAPGPAGCGLLPFTVIFEYGVGFTTCRDVKSWATDWAKLDSLGFGSAAYLNHLEGLTKLFTNAGRPAHLNQLRTNEIALAGPWELREFQPRVGFGLLETTVAATADLSHNFSPLFASFVQQVPTPTDVPLSFGTPPSPPNPSVPFRAAASIAPGGFFWDAPGLVPGFSKARHEVSLMSCNGCHTGETGTPFVHIDPTTIPSALSLFLTGVNGFPDPADPGLTHDFDALEDREADIKAMSGALCAVAVPAPLADPATAESLAVPLDELLREPPRFVH